jgi:hypothetical protein
MKKAKLVCKLLSNILFITGILYGAMTLYSALCIFTGWNITPYGEGNYLHINYPFTNQPFLNIDNNTSYMLFSFLIPLALYTLFFLFTSKVFKVFYQPRIFTHDNLKHLKRFYLLNLILPLPVIVISGIFTDVESTMWLLVVVHFILGVFTFLTSLIFQQGLKLQHEQDLFI